MGVLAVIWNLISNLPMLVGVIVELEQQWKSYENESDRAKKVQALKDAIAKAKVSKDTTQLKALVNSIITGEPAPPS